MSQKHFSLQIFSLEQIFEVKNAGSETIQSWNWRNRCCVARQHILIRYFFDETGSVSSSCGIIDWLERAERTSNKTGKNVEILSPKRFSAPIIQLIGSFENVLKAKSCIDSLILKHTGRVGATHVVDDFSNTNIPSCDNTLADHRVCKWGGPAVSTMEFEQVHCPLELPNCSDIPSPSSATLPDVMCSRDGSEQDQPNSPPVEKIIIRSKCSPSSTLEVTVNRN